MPNGIRQTVAGVIQTSVAGVAQTVLEQVPSGDGEFLLTANNESFVKPTEFLVYITPTTTSALPGDTVDVTTTIGNNGEGGTQTVTLTVDNGVGQVDSTSQTLSTGETISQTLSWNTASDQTEQDYTLTVASENDTATQTITVGTGGAPSPVVPV